MFYRRRVARLLPAVIATVIVSVVAASFIYSGETWANYVRAGLYSIASLANVYFWLVSDYFDSDSQSNIFLHMWSLSVEEQFYLVWPFLAVTIGRYYRFAIPTMAALFVLSLASAWWAARFYPTTAFFMMPARIFQFAAGAMVALLHLRPINIPRQIDSFVFGLGIVLILLSSAFSSGAQYNFAIAALLPTIGGALAIMTIHSWAAGLMLGKAMARYVGNRAYSLYLVHWPLFAMTSVFWGANKPFYVDLAMIAGCFALAEVLYRLVEAPFRLRAGSERTNGLRSAGVFVSFAIAMVALVASVDDRSGSNQSITKQLDGSYVTYASSLWQTRSLLSRSLCSIGAGKNLSELKEANCVPDDKVGGKVLIIGDSYTSEAYTMLSLTIPRRRLAPIGYPGCLPMYPVPNNPKISKDCLDTVERQFKLAQRADVSAIVITTNWRWWGPKSLKSTFSVLAATGKPVIVMGVRPTFSLPVPKILDSAAGSAAKANLNSYLSFDTSKKRKEILAALSPHGEQFVYVDLFSYMCPLNCKALTSLGALIYLDTAHISVDAAFDLAGNIARE